MDNHDPRERRQFRVTVDEGLVVVEHWHGAAVGTAEYDSIVLAVEDAVALRDALAAALEHPGSAAVTHGR